MDNDKGRFIVDPITRTVERFEWSIIVDTDERNATKLMGSISHGDFIITQVCKYFVARNPQEMNTEFNEFVNFLVEKYINWLDSLYE